MDNLCQGVVMLLGELFYCASFSGLKGVSSVSKSIGRNGGRRIGLPAPCGLWGGGLYPRAIVAR